MEYAVVSIAALVVSALALYSGFGLGTLLMPVFAIFFPVSVAVACTAVVHLANNLFRVGIVGRRADWRIVLLFGLPAIAFALLGAFLLVRISDVAALASYHIGSAEFTITTVKLVVAGLIIFFAMFELVPALGKIEFPRKYIPLGGALSGFFGGLSGHQGALRSAVLSKVGLETAVFIGTVSICAFMVDVSRLAVYGVSFFAEDFSKATDGKGLALIGTATLAAFVGTYASSRLLKKVTMKTIRLVVEVMLMVLGIVLAVGLV
jgi:uncharacterized membrane protein YfcA